MAGILYNGNQEKLQGFLRKKTDPFWELQNLIKVLSRFKRKNVREQCLVCAKRKKYWLAGWGCRWNSDLWGGKRKINTQILRFPLPASLSAPRLSRLSSRCSRYHSYTFHYQLIQVITLACFFSNKTPTTQLHNCKMTVPQKNIFTMFFSGKRKINSNQNFLSWMKFNSDY